MQTQWLAVVLAFLAGVLGAVQVGRVAPAVASIGAELDLGLSALGWLVSLITLASALGGLAAGLALRRLGARRLLLLGCTIHALTAALAALAPSVAVLLGLRAVEGIGYLCLVVAAPTLIAQVSTPRDIPRALALWGTFFTAGLSLAAFAGGWASNALGWRAWFGLNGLVMATFVPVLWLFIGRDDTGTPPQATGEATGVVPPAVWQLGVGFLGVALSALAILSMMPSYLIEIRAIGPGVGGSITGLVALASIVGSLIYGVFGTRAPGRRHTVLAALAVIALTVFPAFWAGIGTGAGIACAAIAVGGTGVLVAHVFASIPRLAVDPAKVGPANGLVAQIGSLGALSGPPVVGALVAGMGWMALPGLVLVSLLTFLTLAGIAERTARTHRGT